MERKKGALILDFDGVMVERFPYQFTAMWEFQKHGPAIYLPKGCVRPISRETNSKDLGVAEKIFLLLHLNRKFREGVVETIPQLTENWDLFITTARPRKREFIDLTENTLRQGKILGHFKEIFYKPPGYETTESKMSVFPYLYDDLGYEEIKYLEDNPADALPISREFPELDVRLMWGWSTGPLLVGVRKPLNVILVYDFRSAGLAKAA